MAAASDSDESIMDAKTMDGPTMKWAPNDLLRSNPRAFMTYHVMMSGYDYLTPLGVLIGGGIGLTPLKKRIFPRMTAVQAAGTVGFGAGLAGMCLGYGLMYKISTAKEPKLPWND